MNTFRLLSVLFCAELTLTSLAIVLALACRWAEAMSGHGSGAGPTMAGAAGGARA